MERRGGWPRGGECGERLAGRQRQANQLRSMLREFYPAAVHAFDDLAGRDTLAVLAAATTPAAGQASTVQAIVE